MLRRRRVFVEGGIDHVYNRFARGADLLADPVSCWGSRGAEMRQESEDFREAYEKLDTDLAKRSKRRK